MPPSVLQPGQEHVPEQAWHEVYEGVPVQLGTWKVWGAEGRRPIVPQQMRSWPTVQSLSDLHDLGQLDEQMPPQQIGDAAVPAQSESPVHDLGQEVPCRQRPFAEAARLGSSTRALAQQISPAAVSHCVSPAAEEGSQVAGQSFAGVQKGVE